MEHWMRRSFTTLNLGHFVISEDADNVIAQAFGGVHDLKCENTSVRGNSIPLPSQRQSA